MLLLFVLQFLFSAINISALIFTDINCTRTEGTTIVYSDTAYNCNNNLPDSVCEALYLPKVPTDTPSVFVEGSDPHRPYSCFSYGANEIVFVQELKTLSLQNCPKRCGFCCQIPERNCPNAQFPRLNCASITRSQCLSPEWRTIIATDCPSACGFCLLGGCVDAVPSCANDISICTAIGVQDFVNKNCQRTCGRCSSTTVVSSAVAAAPCTPPADSNRNCALWKANGFCTNSFYTQIQKKAYCARTCGIC